MLHRFTVLFLSLLYNYTARSYPPAVAVAEADVQQVQYYDDYAWNTDAALGFVADQTPRWPNATGLPTGGLVRNTENGGWFKNINYYDDKNRNIQTKSSNHLGGIDQIDYEYNFIGELLKERKIYRRTGVADLTTITTYTRDHAGRVTATKHTLNGAEKNIAAYEYDEIGRLKRKKINPFAANITRTATPPNLTRDLATQWVELLPNTSITATATNTYVACIVPRDALQTVDYNYHIQGAVNCINCLNGVPTLNAGEGDLFAMKLGYEEDGRFYNGLISKQSWITAQAGNPRSYVYDYDAVNRLKSAAYAGVGAENYSLSNLNYDPNGNIQTLQRFGNTSTNSWGLIDNLSYDYSNKINQLQNITENADNTNGFASAGSGSYEYWPDGSLKKDLNKGIAEVTYNYLTLPQKVTLTDGRWVEYFYDSEGSKYKQVQSDGREYHYLGDVLYFKGISSQPLKIYEVQHDEGRIVSNGSALVYEYGYYDHLGNLRVSYTDSAGVAVISQQNDYDPWGVPLTGLNRASRFANANFYTFNGQEQLEIGYQNMGWRWMDNLTGRMSGIDPKDQFASGYVGLGNNPVMGTDPDGQWVHIAIGAVIGGLVNLGTKAYQGKIRNFGDGLAAFGIGAVAGGITAATGGAGAVYASTGSFATAFSATAVAASSTGFLGGAIAGTVGSAFGSGVQGLSNAAYFGDPYSLQQYGQDVLLSGILGGISGGIAAALQDKPLGIGRPGADPGKPSTWFPDWGKKWTKTNAGWKLSGSNIGPATFNSAELIDGSITIKFAGMTGSGGGNFSSTTNSLKQTYLEAVGLATQRYGGNVTVQRNGIDLFRVHQPNSGHGLRVTQFRNSHVISPKTGLPFRNNVDVPVRATHLRQLQKALGGVGNYSIRTRGGR